MNYQLSNNPYIQIAQMDKGMESNMTAREQLNSRPKIDDVVCHYLDGETLKKALHFIDNLYANGMKIKWSDVNVWSVHHRYKHICNVAIEKGVLKVYQISDDINTEQERFVYDTESMMSIMSILRDTPVGRRKAAQAAH